MTGETPNMDTSGTVPVVIATAASGLAHRQREFSSDLAHELRTPIAAARLELEAALLYEAESDVGLPLQRALDAVQRLQAIVSDLLFLEQLDAHKSSPRQSIDLTSLVYGQITQRTRRRVHLHLEPGVTVQGRPDLLTRLLSNLLDNAEQHGGPTITVILRTHACHAVLTVADDGPGIPAPHVQRVFDWFYRPDPSRSRQTGGAGLGLTIAHEIAIVHNGRLTVENSRYGARLRCLLPLSMPFMPPARSGR